MGRLVIKFPTRNRPDKFKSVFSRYLTFLSGRHTVQFIITLDVDDPTMNNHEMQQWLCTRANNVKIHWHFGHAKSKVEACNSNLENADGDVLLLASDDMVPVEMGYDQVIFNAFSVAFPDFDGAIKFWDGYRPKDDLLMTLSIIGFPLYRRFGYIYNPQYKSLYCDNEQSQVLAALGKLGRSDRCIIQHQWTSEPFDILHARNEGAAMYQIDGETFERRKADNFGLFPQQVV